MRGTARAMVPFGGDKPRVARRFEIQTIMRCGARFLASNGRPRERRRTENGERRAE
jgi:hypothetical protein